MESRYRRSSACCAALWPASCACRAVQGYAFTNPADHYMRLMSRSKEVEEEADYVKRIEALADHQKQHAALLPVQGYRLPARHEAEDVGLRGS
jgi:hypothetical protein